MIITFAGLEIWDWPPHPLWEGFLLEPGGLDGWDDPAGMKRDNTARPGGHGSFSLPGFRADRAVAVTGTILANSESRVRELQLRLASLPEGEYLPFTVQRKGSLQWAPGTFNGGSSPELAGGSEITEAAFQLQVWMPDPWKFGESRPYPVARDGSVQVVNRGARPSWPTALVTGPISSGWSLLGLTVNRAVASGETVSIDTSTGAVVSSRVGELMGVVTGYPQQLPVGVSVVSFQASGSGSAVVTVTDTFV